MGSHTRRLLEAFTGLEVAIIGEAMLDSYLRGEVQRLCREAPVPVVKLSERADVPGGAANTAVNARGLGARVSFLSVIGDDDDGERLLESLSRRGLKVEGIIRQPSRNTLVKQRVFADSQMTVRIDQGTTAPIDRRAEASLIERLQDTFVRADAVIVSDYGYGVLTPRLIETIAELQRRHPRVLVVDAKQLDAYRTVAPTAVKPNYQEALRLLGIEPCGVAEERAGQVAACEARLLELTGAQIVAVTLDVDGALVFERGGPAYRTYARPSPQSRATGAGDTFVSALTLALAAGEHTPGAAELASAAAGVVVAKGGTAACSARELQGHLAADKVVSEPDELAARLELLRDQGRRIVFTNGCFDILHRGHITYLNRAKALGDVLIVGLNADASVRALKGRTRPINTLADRAQVLAGLSCIDHIVPFEETTPAKLIEAIRPHVFIKGGDYSRDSLPEAALVERLGGEVRILPYLENHSTTSIIERIQAAYAPAGESSWPAKGYLRG